MNVRSWPAVVLSTLAVWAGELAAQGAAAAPLAVRVEAPEAVFVGEAFDAVVEVDYDADWFAEHAVPLVRRATAVPFHVDVPWLEGDALRVAVLPPAAGVDAVGVPLGDRERAFVRDTSGARTALRLQLRCVAAAAGPLALGGPAVRYAFADEFRDHLLRGREPVDRREATVTAEARVVAVRPLPQPAPADFCGVVGDVQLSATASVAAAVVGTPFELLLDVASASDLTPMSPPRPPQLDAFAGQGFVVQGVVERPAQSGTRRFALDLLPLREGAGAVPAVTLTVFSPQRGDYVTVATPTTPVRVDAAPDLASLPQRVRELVAADRAARGLDGGVPWSVWFAIGVVGCAVASLWWRARRRSARRAELAELAAAVRSLAGGDAAALCGAFEQLLARATDAPSFALARVVEALRAGRGDELGAAVEALWRELDAARFGGPRPSAERVVAVVDQVVARG